MWLRGEGEEYEKKIEMVTIVEHREREKKEKKKRRCAGERRRETKAGVTVGGTLRTIRAEEKAHSSPLYLLPSLLQLFLPFPFTL